MIEQAIEGFVSSPEYLGIGLTVVTYIFLRFFYSWVNRRVIRANVYSYPDSLSIKEAENKVNEKMKPIKDFLHVTDVGMFVVVLLFLIWVVPFTAGDEGHQAENTLIDEQEVQEKMSVPVKEEVSIDDEAQEVEQEAEEQQKEGASELNSFREQFFQDETKR